MRLEILESKNTVALTNYKGVWPGGIIVARVKDPAVPLSNNYFFARIPVTKPYNLVPGKGR